MHIKRKILREVAYLLAQEVTDFNGLTTALDDTVYGEMGIYKTHLVLETLCDTNDHVVYQGADSAEASVVLAATLPDCEGDFACLGGEDLDVHSDMSYVLLQSPSWSGDSDETGLDGNGDARRHVELLGLDNVSHFFLTRQSTELVKVVLGRVSSFQNKVYPSIDKSPYLLVFSMARMNIWTDCNALEQRIRRHKDGILTI